jgi:signal transduction histidine kinase
MTTRLAPVHFLLVDDLEENLLSLEAILRREDLVLLKARSGEEALELLLKHEVALALLDVQMPGMDGFELAEFMRGNERTKHAPIIFLTAGSADGQRHFRGYEAGAVDFIQKPIEVNSLRSKANVFFELYRQRQLIAVQRDALADADRQKDHFLAVLGHELRNPLAALSGGLHLMKSRSTLAETAELRERMEHQVSHMTRLVSDLLDISRIKEGKISLRLERIELSTVLQAAIEASRPKIDAMQHSLRTHVPDEPVWLVADPTRLSQVVSNLLNNAAKYTPLRGDISLAATAREGMLDITVTDTGLGIPLDMQPRIFEMFTQVPGHLIHAQDGLGIGLPLVKTLVELHGGDVLVASDGPGMGSVFTVRLPLDGGRL